MMMHKSRNLPSMGFLNSLEGRQMQRASVGIELFQSQHGCRMTGQHLALFITTKESDSGGVAPVSGTVRVQIFGSELGAV